MSYNDNVPAVHNIVTFEGFPIFEGDWIDDGIPPVTMLMVNGETTDLDNDDEHVSGAGSRKVTWANKRACWRLENRHNQKHVNARARSPKGKR